jgi:hypothetical protein
MFIDYIPLLIFAAFAGIGFAVLSKGFWVWGKDIEEWDDDEA